MGVARLLPRLSRDYAAAARAYALDLISTTLLFVSASVMAGRVWRFPFDDEVYTLQAVERFPLAKMLGFYLGGGDVHPPLQYVFAAALHHLGLSEAGMRLCSLAMTALALALFQLLALTLIAQRHRTGASPALRIVAVLLFGLCALAVGQGDAIRWYPLFAVQIALFVTLYLAGGDDAARFWSAVPLGLAASTNFLAALVILPLAIYRYGLQRQWHASFEAAFWLVVALFASLGVYTAYSVFVHHAGLVGLQLGHGVVRAALTDALGFFGGDALGISQAWIVVPAVVISAIAMVSAIDRKHPADPVHLLVLLLAAAMLMVLPGFAKPRSFLYLAPVLAAVLTLFFDSQVRSRAAWVAALLASLVIGASVAAIANIKAGTHPFKRNSVIPYRSIVDFIAANGAGSELVISTDPVIPWVLRHRPDRDRRCVSFFLNARECLSAERRYDSIFIIAGHSDKSENDGVMRSFANARDKATAGRKKLATLHAGVDEDAELKSRLTGVPLDKIILTVDLYR